MTADERGPSPSSNGQAVGGEAESVPTATPSSSTAVLRPPTPTPVPWRSLLALLMVQLNEAIGVSMLLPFVGFLVARIDNDPDISAAGYRVGFLIAMFQLAQFFSCRRWGRFSDKFGRKVTLQLGLAGSAVVVVGFGFTTRLWYAMLFRFLHGIANGNVAVAKTVIADITDSTNRAVGYAAISASYGIGGFIGPAIGGMFYDPTNNPSLSWMGLAHDGVFATYPALLPCLLTACYSVTALGLSAVLLPETNRRAERLNLLDYLRNGCRAPKLNVKPEPVAAPATATGASPAPPPTARTARRTNAIASRIAVLGMAHSVDEGLVGKHLAKPFSVPELDPDALAASAPVLPRATTLSLGEEDELFRIMSPTSSCADFSRLATSARTHYSRRPTMHLASHNTPVPGSGQSSPNQRRRPTESVAATVTISHRQRVSDPAPPPKFGWSEVYRRPKSRYTVIKYMLISAVDYGFSECFPLWAMTSRARGGLAWDAETIGWFNVLQGVFNVAVNLAFPYACRLFPSRYHLWRISLFVQLVCTLAVPWTAAVASPLDVGLLSLASLGRVAGSFGSFGLIYLFVAEAAPPEVMGEMAGIAQASVAIVRCGFPIVAAPTFAYSVLHAKPPWLDIHTVFIVFALILAAGMWVSHRAEYYERIEQEAEHGEAEVEGELAVVASPAGADPSTSTTVLPAAHEQEHKRQPELSSLVATSFDATPSVSVILDAEDALPGGASIPGIPRATPPPASGSAIIET